MKASESVGFARESRAEVYRWVEKLLCYHEYWTQKRQAKGLIRAYIERMTGMSRAQCTRLIGQYRKTGQVPIQRSQRHKFARRYKVEDVAQLVRVNQAHERISGPATAEEIQNQRLP